MDRYIKNQNGTLSTTLTSELDFGELGFSNKKYRPHCRPN